MKTCVCTKKEIKLAILQMKNSFAREDEVLSRVIKKA